MNLDLGTQYYLKALDYYPYNLEFTIENLQYAISYDPENPQALSLMGMIYMFFLKEYHEAKKCFQQAIASDANFPDSYKLLSILYIWLGKYDAAQRLIDFAIKRPGHDKATLLRIQAMRLEYLCQYAEARKLLKKVKMISQCSQVIKAVELDRKRLKSKLSGSKPKSRKKK